MTTTAIRPRPVRRGSQGWVPNQHGAWAMVVVPWLLGFVWVLRNDGAVAASLLLFACWLSGYFAFFAVSQWLRSRFRPRYLPAVRAYTVATGVLGVGVLAMQPQWWSWAVVFAPLAALSLWLAWRRRDRGLVSGIATVAAASLLPLVMGGDGVWPGVPATELVGVSLVCFGYFFGTVLYVKTIIRERGSLGWVLASVSWHLACVLVAVLVPSPLPRLLVAVFFGLMALRAWFVPWLGPLRGHNFTARAVGFGEFGATALLVALLLVAP